MEAKLKRPTRFWHEPAEETRSIDLVYKLGSNIGSIDQVNKPDKMQSINQVRNQVDKPQTADQVYTPGSIKYEKLRGNPLRVIRFLFKAVDNFQQKTTRKIQLCEIMQTLEITRDSTRTGLRFLNKSGLISTVEYSAGLNGWTRYKIKDAIFNEIWSIDQVNQSGFKPGLSSSNSNLNTITTPINPVYLEIDISPLEGTGFTKEHLTKFTKISTEDIQFSINHFAFAYKNKYEELKKKYDDPLKVFIGRLCNGKLWVEHDYVSEEEVLLRDKLEARKREKERLTKLEDEMLNLELSDWLANLSESQKEEIWPATKKGMPQEVALKLHFKERVWPGIKANVLRGT